MQNVNFNFIEKCRDSFHFVDSTLDNIICVLLIFQPPFSVNRFTCAILTGYWWGYLFISAVPTDTFFDINWKFLYWLAPIPVTIGNFFFYFASFFFFLNDFSLFLGVWTVGNIGRQCGKPWLAFLTSLLVCPSRYWVSDDTWITLMVFFSALVFDSYSKEWRRTPPKKRSLCK